MFLVVCWIESKAFWNCWVRKQGEAQPLAGQDMHRGGGDLGFLQQAVSLTAAVGGISVILPGGALWLLQIIKFQVKLFPLSNMSAPSDGLQGPSF